MNYIKHEDKKMEIVAVKEELELEFEELEFEELDFEDSKPEEFGNKVIELLGLQNVPADADGSKVTTNRDDQESSKIIIKEEIDCNSEDGSVSELDSLHFADKVPGPTLRRSKRRRFSRFSLDDLLESSGDETSVSKHSKKIRTRSSSRCICEKDPRLSAARGARLPEGGNKSSDRCTFCGKASEQFCDICGRWFSRIGYLRRHAATHSGSKPYSCGPCGKRFSRSDNLKEHERLHRGENFRCSECGKEFSQAGHLKQHVREHTGERPFRCADCGKVFRVRGYLLEHVRIHTGERPFACRVCGKSFRQAAHLRGHARLHTGERRHGCDVCGRLFFRRTHLKIHACARSASRRRQRKVPC